MLARADSLCDLVAAPRYMAGVAETRGAATAAMTRSASLDAEDENALMRQIGGGDAAAYRVMAERYLAKVHSFASRLLGDRAEAEDVAQETFLKLWTEAPRFAPRAKPSTWLYRIAHNACVDRLRKRRDAGADALERQATADRPSGLLARKETAQEVTEALASLPERQRAAITLIHYQGLSSSEAAEVLDVGAEALESLLARGRRSLREQLAHLAPTEGETP